MTKSIEQIFIDRISRGLTFHSERNSGAHRFACPHCQVNGINKKGKKIRAYEATGFLYRYGSTNAWNFKCHSCGRGYAFEKFLEMHFQREHFQYVCHREQLGTTGFQTNCPSLETLLKKRGMLGNPPEFRPERVEQDVQKSHLSIDEPPPQQVQKPVMQQSAPSECHAPKLIKLPPVLTREKLAGHQAPFNRREKQRERRRREREGW